MNVYLDVATKDFCLFFFNNKKEIIHHVLIKDHKKKVALIVEVFIECLKELNIEVANIDAYYTNIGPGFFTGVRSSLVFFRTMALVFNKPIFTISSFEILLHQQPKRKFLFMDAQGSKIYKFNLNVYKQTNSLEKAIKVKKINKEIIQNIDFELLINNFSSYIKYFKKHDQIMEIEPLYVKMPQIGVIKQC